MSKGNPITIRFTPELRAEIEEVRRREPKIRPLVAVVEDLVRDGLQARRERRETSDAGATDSRATTT